MRRFIAIFVLLALAVPASIIAGDRFMEKPGYFWIAGMKRLGWLPPDIEAFPGWASIKRRSTGNDALACAPGRCPATQVDFESPVFEIPATRLLAKIEAIIFAEPRTVRLDETRGGATRADYQQASALLRFPDIINIEVFEVTPETSTLAIWSRSVVGRKDFGVNRGRVERLLSALKVTRYKSAS